MNYKEYLQTGHWQNLRGEVFLRWGHRCACCGGDYRIEVHHLVYQQLTDCVVDDLLPLCEDCHGLVHECKRLWRGRYFKVIWIRDVKERRKELVKMMEDLRNARYAWSKRREPVTLNCCRLDPNHGRPWKQMDYAEYQKKFG